MRTLLIVVLVILVVYLLYSNGTLSRLIPGLPDPKVTPQILVTLVPPVRIDPLAGVTTPSPAEPAETPIPSPTPTPVIVDVATPLPAQPTLPPPTIIVPEIPPTLAVSTTPTPASIFPLTIDTPRDGETVSASPWLVVGQTQPGALVSVNDAVGFANDEGRFSLPAALLPGVNVLEVIASNTAGEEVFVILTVVYQP
ncbi:MAG TPA: hypothetical protein VFL17_20140 [Anaerolineae bacterium]|nr:hypothetical protein [Anaerolineae bacterium]